MNEPARNTFSITVTIDSSLDVDDVWPDGDAPENPTADDVKKELFKGKEKPSSHEVKRALEDWNLLDVDASCVSVSAMTPPCDKCRRQFGHRKGCENDRPKASSLAPAAPHNTAEALNRTFSHVPLTQRPVFCQKCGANGIDDQGECRECGHVQEAPK